jgi:hypothetical protein
MQLEQRPCESSDASKHRIFLLRQWPIVQHCQIRKEKKIRGLVGAYRRQLKFGDTLVCCVVCPQMTVQLRLQQLAHARWALTLTVLRLKAFRWNLKVAARRNLSLL